MPLVPWHARPICLVLVGLSQFKRSWVGPLITLGDSTMSDVRCLVLLRTGIGIKAWKQYLLRLPMSTPIQMHRPKQMAQKIVLTSYMPYYNRDPLDLWLSDLRINPCERPHSTAWQQVHYDLALRMRKMGNIVLTDPVTTQFFLGTNLAARTGRSHTSNDFTICCDSVFQMWTLPATVLLSETVISWKEQSYHYKEKQESMAP